MKKISFSEKNNFVLKYTDKKYFSVDFDLFKNKFPPNHKLNKLLARANSHTYEKLDGQMIYALLDVVSPEEILNNRGVIAPKEVVIESIDQAKEILVRMDIDPEKVSEDFLSESIGKAAIAFESLMEALKPSLTGENKILTLSVIPSGNDSTPIDSIEEVKEFLTGVFSDSDEIPEELISKLVGKTKEEILMAIDFIKMYTSITNKNDGLSTEAETGTSQDVSETTEINEPGVKNSDDNPENGNHTDGVPDADSVSELENENKSGSNDETGKDTSGMSEDEKLSRGFPDGSASDELPLNQELEEKAKELEEKEEELADKELELKEKEEELEDKAQVLEEKEKDMEEKESKAKQSSKKKETKPKSSRK